MRFFPSMSIALVFFGFLVLLFCGPFLMTYCFRLNSDNNNKWSRVRESVGLVSACPVLSLTAIHDGLVGVSTC